MVTANSVFAHACMHREREAVVGQGAVSQYGKLDWHCRRLRAGAAAGSRGQRQQGFTLIELMIVIAILAILMAIAVPVYSIYATRAKVSECLYVAAPMKLSISEVTMTLANGNFPADAAEAVIEPANIGNLDYCEAGTYSATGELTIPVDEAAIGATGTIEMVLQPTLGPNGNITWDCLPGATSADAIIYLPSSCRN
jgi:type IV pilus assembly protein PilA